MASNTRWLIWICSIVVMAGSFPCRLCGVRPTILRNDLIGLDHQQTALVMTAIAHASGFTEATTTVNGNRIVSLPPLALWPE